MIGAAIRRTEDERLLRGRGRFIADVAVPGALHAAFVRSSHAHARIVAVEAAAVRSIAGVVAVFAAADIVADGLGGIPWEVRPPAADPNFPEGAAEIAPPQPAIARERTRYVGEIVAMVVAESASAAADGAERVEVIYEALAPVVAVEDAVRPGAAVIDPQFPDNVGFVVRYGDRDATEAAFGRAAHVARLHLLQNRINDNPIETRGSIGSFAAGRFTLHAACGKPHPIRRTMARFVFDVPEDRIRIVTGDAGGGFGAKNVLYPEAVLVLFAARRIGRPVGWLAGRDELFVSDVAARDMVTDAEMALDGEHRILALRVRTLANLGAWLAPRAVNPVRNSIRLAPGVYRVPVADLEARGIFTNSVPTCPIRGAGQPEAIGSDVRASRGRQRHMRCARGVRHSSHRHAVDARARAEGDTKCVRATAARGAFALVAARC